MAISRCREGRKPDMRRAVDQSGFHAPVHDGPDQTKIAMHSMFGAAELAAIGGMPAADILGEIFGSQRAKDRTNDRPRRSNPVDLLALDLAVGAILFEQA